MNEDVMFDFTAKLAGTRDRSEYVTDNGDILLCTVCYTYRLV